VVVQQGDAIVRVKWGTLSHADKTPLLQEAMQQLEDYFSGALKQFDLPLDYQCSAYQQQICQAMLEIPYGETITYGELAETTSSSAQAVGNACGGNPLPIIVPCHRVLAAQGLGGYSGEGGLETKITLLKLESSVPWLI
jgi:methylated-DNA-[protein]-cysteine S-methyltransferase